MFVNQVASQRTERVSVAGGVYPDVEAQITLPDRPSAGLVVVPGWNSSGNRPLFVEMARRYASMGIGTLRYDPAYCVDSQHVDLHRTTEEITALSSFAHARITPKTFLLGASLGAFAIGAFLVRHPEFKPAGIISRAGALRSARFGEPVSAEPFEALVTIAAPVLLLHGDRDEVIGIELSQELAERRQKAGLPTVFIRYEGFGHTVQDHEINRIVEDIGGFISRYR